MAPNITSVPLLERLGQPLPARGELLGRVAHALGVAEAGGQQRRSDGDDRDRRSY